MKSFRLGIFGLFAGVAIAACADDSDTVLSLNIAADDNVGFVSTIHVKVTQGSKTPVERDFTMLPTKTVGEAGATQTVLAGGFFERIELPDSWSDGAASVDVECFDEAGESTLHPPPVTAKIKQNETVAVFVVLKRPDAMGGAGAGGAGPGGTGGAPTDAGGAPTDAGGAPTDAGGAPTDAGGAPTNAGGAPTDAGGAPSDTGGTSPTAGATSAGAGGSSDSGG